MTTDSEYRKQFPGLMTREQIHEEEIRRYAEEQGISLMDAAIDLEAEPRLLSSRARDFDDLADEAWDIQRNKGLYTRLDTE